MRNRKTQGFTLIELLIVIAIIGILAAVLIPNLLSARQRAFDTSAQTCLKEIAAQEEMLGSVDPWNYSSNAIVNTGTTAGPLSVTVTIDGTSHPVVIQSCNGVTVLPATHSDATIAGTPATAWYSYTGYHVNGGNQYRVEVGRGVTHEAAGLP